MGKEVEVLYYPSSEHKEADLRLCFRICKTLVFSRGGSFTAIVITLIIHTGISNAEIYDRACMREDDHSEKGLLVFAEINI